MTMLDGLAENYRKKLRRHADSTVRLVTGIFSASAPKSKAAVNLAASRIAIANRQAEALAVQYVNTARTAVALPAMPLPVKVEDDTKRIAGALQKAREEGPAAVRMLARSEVLQSAQRTVGEALVTTGQAWVRHTGPSPCPLCKRLADGKPRPAKVPMAIGHPNCSCTPVPVEDAPWQAKRRKPRKAVAKKAAPKKAVAKKAPAKKAVAKKAATPQKARRTPRKAI